MSLYDKASLVLIPSGTKAGTVYSQKPTSGDGDFDFTRSTYATRVNSQGLIEKERSNLLLQSNTFDTTWSSSNLNITSGQSGYDGSSDAWLLDISGGTGQQRIEQNVTASGVTSYSIYAKANTLDWLLLYVNGSPTTRGYFDVANGVVGQTANLIDSKIESVGSGWYRCTIVYDEPITNIRLYLAENDNDITQTSGSIYIQDAQLEQGLVATDVIETTTSAVYTGITDNVPRLDYDGDCPFLLLEPSRTNVLLYSEYFGDSYWQKNDVLVEGGYLAPDGTNSAYKITDNGSNAHLVKLSVTDSDDSRSIYARTTSGTGQVHLLSHSSNANCFFTITEEWQRFEVSSVGSIPTHFYAVDFRGVGTTLNEVIIYGAQVEEGSYATSYIPTYGTSVTRNGDVCNNATTNSTGYYWTLFIDYADFKNGSTSGDDSIIFYDSSDATIFRLWGLAGAFAIRSFSGDSSGNYYINNQFGLTAKAIVRYDGTEIGLFIDGVKQTITSPSPLETNWNQIAKVSTLQASDNKYRLNKFVIFPEALTDQECIDLTT